MPFSHHHAHKGKSVHPPPSPLFPLSSRFSLTFAADCIFICNFAPQNDIQIIMSEVFVKESELVKAAEEGMDAFVSVFVKAIYDSVGGKLDANTMALLNADQVTLLAYVILRDEVMDGGFVQLIHNGYGPFIFKNPFSKMMRNWGLDALASLVNKAHKPYSHHHEEIERDCTDEEFMALFEQLPEFDDLDDEFVENEEEWTGAVACYIDEHLDRFATIVK